ncbi:hypothetical protein NDN08_008037 [Rhodosorus marinus]|uniref:Uncharacterized protein n=1 Tax=Rhodosorus marinus TaxID=101924 RepID=A0AAV8UZK7_9RHOD|nr:hypothetical protein NDN08_008037 [Rhodosorus marinus]
MERKVAILDERLGEKQWKIITMALGDSPARRLIVCEENLMIFDLLNFQPKYGAWLMLPDDGFIEGGEFLIVSEVDPLFVALRLLEESDRSVFQPKPVLLSSIALNLTSFCSADDLKCITQWAQIGDEVVHRLDHDKVMRWLKLKLKNTEATGLGRDDALDVISRYTSTEWIQKLREDFSEKSTEPGRIDSASFLNYNNSSRVGESVQDVTAKENEKEQPKKRVKNRLASVDKSGMKPLSQFFKKK